MAGSKATATAPAPPEARSPAPAPSRRGAGPAPSGPAFAPAQRDAVRPDETSRGRDAYRLARTLAALVRRLEVPDPELGARAARAAEGALRSLAEGLSAERGGLARRAHLDEAERSLREAAAAIGRASSRELDRSATRSPAGSTAPRPVPRRRAREILALARRVRRMIRALLQAG